ncbi:MAG: SUMF1/EgtB/PvdO family nonheme iron enzyme [Spirochaetaceae bacterium]|nr:SUMF1/EgtB/PvdO family nonheme iron enzyme [Spirochaetaceae bacterium]
MKKTKTRKMWVFLLALVLGLGTVLSCENWMVEKLLGQKNEEEKKAPVSTDDGPVAVEGISLESNILKVTVGMSIDLRVKVYPAHADQGVEWESSDPTVLTVNGGTIIPVRNGNAIITVKTRDGHTAICFVTIGYPPLVEVDTFVQMNRGTIVTNMAWGGTSGSNGAAKSSITVEPFQISKTEVRYELWYEVKQWGEAHGYTFPNQGQAGTDNDTRGKLPTEASKNHPVAYINWRDVVVWCNAYSEFKKKDPVYRKTNGDVIRDGTVQGTGQNVEDQIDEPKMAGKNGYRLPTEIEWEYAARGGVPSTEEPWTYRWPGGNTISDLAWYKDNAIEVTHPVGLKDPNSAGLRDMGGNVWEWCWDIFSGTNKSSPRVVRGGGWYDGPTYSSVYSRLSNTIDRLHANIGFRPVCAAD